MAPYNSIAERNVYDERLAFVRKLLAAKQNVVSFVDKHLGWDGEAQYDGLFKGSFNICMDVRRGGTGEHVVSGSPLLAKFTKRWREEKVRNEVAVMEYLREHSSIPVLRVRCWRSSTDDGPQNLGPFIIMDLVEGQELSSIIQQPNQDPKEPLRLDLNIDEASLDTIYDQIAGYLLEISSLLFPRIGAISKDAATNAWAVISRPLTYDMNELVTFGEVSATSFDSLGAFCTAHDFFLWCARCLQEHLAAQRNIV